jgi:hypothetical protein
MSDGRIYKLMIISLVLSLLMPVKPLIASCDVYFVTYATRDGKTGHSGLAVDNYVIHVHDTLVSGCIIRVFDTVKTGTLTYFDFWPEKDHFSIRNVGKDTRAKYNRLPAASYEKEITLDLLVNYGVPHVENRPCDGILRLETDPAEDYDLINYMDSIIALDKPFNVRKFNCSDFVLAGASYITHRKIRAKEFIPFSFSTTPNRLFKRLRALSETEVIVDPGKKVNGIFFKERILKVLLSEKALKKRTGTLNANAE